MCVSVCINLSHQLNCKAERGRFGTHECCTDLVWFLPYFLRYAAQNSNITYFNNILEKNLNQHLVSAATTTPSTLLGKNSCKNNVGPCYVYHPTLCFSGNNCPGAIWLSMAWMTAVDTEISQRGKGEWSLLLFSGGPLFRIRNRSSPLHCPLTKRLPLRYV